MIYGIDEAGRGPILGPMVLAVVGVNPAAIEALTAAGVKDSKGFGSGDSAKRKRAKLYELILGMQVPVSGADSLTRITGPDPAVHIASWTVSTQQIDNSVGSKSESGGLNRLEQRVARDLLLGLKIPRCTCPSTCGSMCFAHPALMGTPQEIWADGATMFGPLRADFPGLQAVNNGESAHVSVAAASIVAKHIRDEAMAAIERKYEKRGYGKITGGGYLNAGTRKFLNEYITREGRLPDEARASWNIRSVLSAADIGPRA